MSSPTEIESFLSQSFDDADTRASLYTKLVKANINTVEQLADIVVCSDQSKFKQIIEKKENRAAITEGIATSSIMGCCLYCTVR